MQRAFDHVMHDIALQNLPVIFCMDRSGVVGPDGPTHHGVFDLSIFRTIPGVIVCAPKDGNELRNLMFSALDWNKPTMIRYPKDTSVNFDKDGKPTFIESGSWEILRDGGDVAILAVGSMVEVARKAAVTLAEEHQISARIINARFVKPLDKDMLSGLAKQNIPIITVEEGLAAGGFGSAVLMQIGQAGSTITIMGIDDEFTEHGTRSELLEMIGLTSADIVKRATEIVGKVAAV
jgi:1-deoxy-D-xylulose-5-phosphate synthase